MTNEEIIQRVNTLLAEEFELDPAALQPEALFREDLGLDSLDAVDMVVLLEQDFQFKIQKDAAFKAIRTVGDLHAFVLAKKQAAENTHSPAE